MLQENVVYESRHALCRYGVLHHHRDACSVYHAFTTAPVQSARCRCDEERNLNNIKNFQQVVSAMYGQFVSTILQIFEPCRTPSGEGTRLPLQLSEPCHSSTSSTQHILYHLSGNSGLPHRSSRAREAEKASRTCCQEAPTTRGGPLRRPRRRPEWPRR